MTLSPGANRRIVRASAIYGLAITAGFATPWTFALAHGQISSLNVAMGGESLPAFTPFHVLFACLMGSVVLVWSALRILEPTQRLGRFDGAARFLFSVWMAWALAVTKAPLLWLLVARSLPGVWCSGGRFATARRLIGSGKSCRHS